MGLNLWPILTYHEMLSSPTSFLIGMHLLGQQRGSTNHVAALLILYDGLSSLYKKGWWTMVQWPRWDDGPNLMMATLKLNGFKKYKIEIKNVNNFGGLTFFFILCTTKKKRILAFFNIVDFMNAFSDFLKTNVKATMGHDGRRPHYHHDIS